MTIHIAMNSSSKSENSTSSPHLSGSATHENREKAIAGKITPTYESATFSRPPLDQLNGILPDFNRRLSSERDLGLSPLGHSRLSPETLPRLVSNACMGIEAAFPETVPEATEIPKGFEIKPDLAGRTLTGARIGSLALSPDLPIAPLASRLVTFRQAEDGLKETEKDRK
ncbi:MAG: hypothetical protein WB014_11250 [Methanosarcina sp.]